MYSYPPYGQPPTRQPPPTPAILFVDPDERSVAHLVAALRTTNDVALVPGAASALQALTLRRPSLIVLELALPDADGYALIQRLRSLPVSAEALIVVLTERASIAEKVAAIQAGAEQVLMKPITVAEFVTQLQLLTKFRDIFTG